MKFYDVIIVGAGVVGNYMACRLASLGYQVIVVDEKESVGSDVCCTGIVGKECFDHFVDDAGLILREAKSATFFSPQGRHIRLAKDTTQAYIMYRATLDETQARKAKGSGAEYLLGAKVEHIVFKETSVKARINYLDGLLYLEARVIILCCGFGSRLVYDLGLGRISDFVMGAQAEVELEGDGEVEVYFGREKAPGFFAWLVPTSEGKGLAGLLTRHHARLYLQKFLLSLYQQHRIATTDVDTGCAGVPLRPLPKTYNRRLLVVGDAAGQVKPTTGGGIYYGLLSAGIAVDVLHNALSADDLSAKQLIRYDKEWRRILSRELQVGYWARRFYEKLSDHQVEQLFHLIESNGIRETLLESDDFSFDWHAGIILGVLKHQALKPLRRFMPW